MNKSVIFLSIVSLLFLEGSHSLAQCQYQQYQQVSPVVVVGIPVTTLGLDYYYSVGRELWRESLKEEIKMELKNELDDEDEPAAEESKLNYQTLSRDAFRLRSKLSSSTDRRVLSLFQTSCISCHKPGASTPGVPLLTKTGDLFRHADRKKEFDRRQKVYDSVKSGAMPKTGKSLNKIDKEAIEDWLKEIS